MCLGVPLQILPIIISRKKRILSLSLTKKLRRRRESRKSLLLTSRIEQILQKTVIFRIFYWKKSSVTSIRVIKRSSFIIGEAQRHWRFVRTVAGRRSARNVICPWRSIRMIIIFVAIFAGMKSPCQNPAHIVRRLGLFIKGLAQNYLSLSFRGFFQTSRLHVLMVIIRKPRVWRSFMMR